MTPADVRDRLSAALCALNQQRHEEEVEAEQFGDGPSYPSHHP